MVDGLDGKVSSGIKSAKYFANAATTKFRLYGISQELFALYSCLLKYMNRDFLL